MIDAGFDDLDRNSRARIGFVRELLRAVANRGVDRCTGKLRYAVPPGAGTSALSIRMRSRISPASDKMPRKGAVAARYRPSTGERASTEGKASREGAVMRMGSLEVLGFT